MGRIYTHTLLTTLNSRASYRCDFSGLPSPNQTEEYGSVRFAKVEAPCSSWGYHDALDLGLSLSSFASPQNSIGTEEVDHYDDNNDTDEPSKDNNFVTIRYPDGVSDFGERFHYAGYAPRNGGLPIPSFSYSLHRDRQRRLTYPQLEPPARPPSAATNPRQSTLSPPKPFKLNVRPTTKTIAVSKSSHRSPTLQRRPHTQPVLQPIRSRSNVGLPLTPATSISQVSTSGTSVGEVLRAEIVTSPMAGVRASATFVGRKSTAGGV